MSTVNLHRAQQISNAAYKRLVSERVAFYRHRRHECVTTKHSDWRRIALQSSEPMLQRRISFAHDHILLADTRTRLLSFNRTRLLASGDSRIKKVGGPLRGQGKSRGANKIIYCICIGPMSTK